MQDENRRVKKSQNAIWVFQNLGAKLSRVSDVVDTIGKNIEAIRRARQMTGKDLSARLNDLGLSMSVATVSEVERGKRKVSAADLLVFAIALNTSVIDLLTPPDGEPLKVAEGVKPLHAPNLESWLSGNGPWPPAPTNSATADEFFETASEFRKRKQRTDMRPEMQEIGALRDAVASAIDGPGPLNETADADVMARQLRDQLDRVAAYVKLLADHLEKNGYASR